MSTQAPTRILTALAMAGVLGFALQADSAGSAPAEQTKAASTAPKERRSADYTFLFDGFLPALRRAGLGEEEVHALLVENPARLFSGV